MSKRILELTTLNTAASGDLLPIVDISEPTDQKTKKVTLQTLLDSVAGAEGANVGSGAEVFKSKSGVTLQLRTLTAGTNVTITQNANDIQISVPDAPQTLITLDNTPTNITLTTLAVGNVAQVDVLVKIASADATVRQVFKLSGLYWGDTGPTATIDGTLSSSASGTGAAVATIGVSGANVVLTITGIAATILTTSYEVNIL